MYTYIHTYILITYIRTCIHMYPVRACIYIYIRTYISHTYTTRHDTSDHITSRHVRAYMLHTCIPTYIHAYIHPCMHAYIHTPVLLHAESILTILRFCKGPSVTFDITTYVPNNRQMLPILSVLSSIITPVLRREGTASLGCRV